MVKIVTICICTAAFAVGAMSFAGCGGNSDSEPTDYKVGSFGSWPHIEKDKQIEGYVENAWRDPPYAYVILAVDSRASSETASPLASSQLARIQTTKLSGYRERGTRWIRLGGRPAVRWAFDVGKRSHIEFFFEECGISFVVRGTSGTYGFSSLSETFRYMAASIKTACSE